MIRRLMFACVLAATMACTPSDEPAAFEEVGSGDPLGGGQATQPPQAEAATQPGNAAVSLASVADIAAFLESNRGKVLVINFWATWCAPCVHEMPELAAFYEAYRDRGVVFLSLSSDALEDYESKLVPFVEERDLPFHVYSIAKIEPDELDAVLKVGMDFALPTTFVFDQQGNQVQKWMRNITRADLERVVDPLLTDEE